MSAVGLELKNSKIRDRYFVKKTISEDERIGVYLANDLNHTDTEVLIRTFVVSEPIPNLEAQLKPYMSLPPWCGAFLYDYEISENFVILISPYLHGQTLASLLKKERLDTFKILTLAESLLKILKEYESRGLHHANINPNSIIIDSSSHYLLDRFHLPFETALLLNHKKMNIQDIFYVSPEQAGLLRQETKISSDLYSLGAVLYEACVGQAPFYADTLASILQKKLREPVASIRIQRKDINRAVEDMIDRLLLKDPLDRYQTVDGVLHDTLLLLQNNKSTSRVVIGQADKRKTISSPSFVDRSVSLKKIQEILHSTQKGNGQVVCVEGLPGEGKTKLLHEIEKIAPSGTSCVYGDAEFLNAKLSSEGTKEHPVFLIFDDFHWADESGFRAIEEWYAHTKSSECYTSVFLGISSLENQRSFDFHPVHLQVKPFDKEEVRGYLQSMAGPLPEEIVQAIYNLSEGNPFFAKGLLEGLEETKAMSWIHDHWAVRETLISKAQCSKKSAETLLKRIPHMHPESVKVLEIASILGNEFHFSLLVKITKMPAKELSEMLGLVLKSHFLIQRTEDCYAFSHEKIRESFMNRLSSQDKQNFHLSIADELLKKTDASDFEISYHLSQAKNFSKAFPYAYKAALTAKKKHEFQVASSQLKIARAGIPSENDSLKFKIALELGCVYLLQKHYEASHIEFERARKYAKTKFEKASILTKLGELDLERGNFESASGYFLAALSVFGKFQAKTKFASYCLFFYETWIHTPLSKIQMHLHSKQTEHVEEKLLIAWAYGRLSLAWCFLKHPIFSLSCSLRYLRLSEVYGSGEDRSITYSNHAQVLAYTGHTEASIHYARKSMSLAGEHGKNRALFRLGTSYYFASRLQEAKESLNQAREDLAWIVDKGFQTTRMNYILAMIAYREGKFKEAHEFAQRLFENGSAFGDRLAIALSLNVQSMCSSSRIDPKLLESEKSKTSGENISQILHLHTMSLAKLKSGNFSQSHAYIQDIWKIIEHSGICTEVIATVACWEASLLRHWLEHTAVYDGTLRIHIFKIMKQALKRAHSLSSVFKNLRPMYLRELALYHLLLGNLSKCQSLLHESMNFASKIGALLDFDLSKESLDKMQVGASEQASLSPLPTPSYEEKTQTGVTLSLLDRFDSLLSIGRMIAGALTEQDVYKDMGLAIESLLRCTQFAVLSFDKEEGVYRRIYGTYTQSCNENYLAKTLKDRQSRVFTWEEPRSSKIQSVLCTPITADDVTEICVYIVNDTGANVFAEDEMNLADFISALVGTALENSRSFHKIKLLTESLERDIEERQEDQRKLQTLLKEKELILREVFHRTKNNMQIVTSMLNLQTINDKLSVTDIIKDCQNRIFSISLVHDKLVHSEDLSSIPVSSYIQDLIEGLRKSYFSSASTIEFFIDVDDSLLSIDHAVPCGLIVNEIITNSIKYAFPEGDKPKNGEIRLSAHKDKVTNMFTLIASDNGIGLSKSLDIESIPSIGIKLIHELVKIQLQGDLSISTEHGTEYTIHFSDSQYVRRI